MSGKFFIWSLTTLLLITVSHGEAQQQPKLSRIGVLTAASPVDEFLEAFRKGLRDLRYIEGQNISIEYRFAEGKIDRLGDLATELVRLKVDVIVAARAPAVRSAMQATKTIPIVMVGPGDPVRTGFVASLARPGGNTTGLSSLATDLSGKRLELLKEAVPKAARVAVILGPGRATLALSEVEAAARALRLQLQTSEVKNTSDLKRIFETATKWRADSLIILPGAYSRDHRKQIIDLTAKHRLPAMCEQSNWTIDGCLMSYGADLADTYRRAAVYVDKILKGTKPADLPVEQPMKFEFIINLKTAKQIGLTIPPNLLVRADKVIR
jgi:putative ABC transport system substrate-binding protein